MTLLPGAEVYFTGDVVERARAGDLMTIADGGRYLLLELPYQQIPMGVDDTIFQLKLLGITPLMAHPERVVVGNCGDGGFLMTLQELATAVQHGVNVIQLVYNNGMYGTIRMHQERDYPGRTVGTDLQNPDFAALATSFGALGLRAAEPDE